jgi:hypothetical protein
MGELHRGHLMFSRMTIRVASNRMSDNSVPYHELLISVVHTFRAGMLGGTHCDAVLVPVHTCDVMVA